MVQNQLTLSVIFFNNVSSSTACNLRLISRQSSKVIDSSTVFEPYIDAMIPLCFASSA